MQTPEQSNKKTKKAAQANAPSAEKPLYPQPDHPWQIMADAGPGVRQLRRYAAMAAQDLSRSVSDQVSKETALSFTHPIQRYPEPISDDDAKRMAPLYSDDYEDKEEDDITAEELVKIKKDVFMLTPARPEGIVCNCIGWAKNDDQFIDPGNMYGWEQEYTSTEPDSEDATILLWGSKEEEEDENKWDIRHAAVELTHEQIVERSKRFNGFTPITAEALQEAKIPDPCWTSVGGFGEGAFVHPKDWFEGGAFGTALKGMY